MLRGLMKVTRYSLWLLAFLLVASAALVSLLPSYLSQAKYVLDPITYTINLSSYTSTSLDFVAITGTPQVGKTLFATITPSEATVNYQWTRSLTSDGTYELIADATASSYVLTASDLNYYFMVTATGTGSYSGTVTSEFVGPVMPAIISIAAIEGVTPPVTGATAVSILPETTQYTAAISWNPVPSGGLFQANTQYTAAITITPKSGYTLTGVSENFFTVAGATTVTNAADSGLVTAVFPSTSAIPLQSVSISGTPHVGQTLSATIAPSEATATYQWQWSTEQNGTFTDISGATASSYVLTAGDINYYFRVQATGTSSYTGTVTSNILGPVTAIPLTSVTVSGTPQIGQTLTANLTPSAATAVYQWQWSTEQNGTFTNISGATASSYFLTVADYPLWIRVQATGTGNYSGTVISNAVGPVAPKTISIAAIEEVTVPTADGAASISITPNAEYSGTIVWSPALTNGTTFASGTVYTATITITPNIGYTLTGVPANFFTVAGATSVSNAANSGVVTAVFPITTTPITAIGPISGTPQVGLTLTAGAVSPAGATITYQWQKSTSAAGPYTPISGATSSSYTLMTTDLNQYITVAATGTGNYFGTVTSSAIGPVTSSTVTNQTIPGVSVPAIGLTATYSLSGTGYTGTIVWNPDPRQNSNKFKNKTVYTATITITTNSGYTLAPGFTFTVPGATSTTTTIISATSATVTAVFPPTTN